MLTSGFSAHLGDCVHFCRIIQDSDWSETGIVQRRQQTKKNRNIVKGSRKQNQEKHIKSKTKLKIKTKYKMEYTRDVYYGKYYSSSCIVTEPDSFKETNRKVQSRRRKSLTAVTETGAKKSNWKKRLYTNLNNTEEDIKAKPQLKVAVLERLKAGKNPRTLIAELEALLGSTSIEIESKTPN